MPVKSGDADVEDRQQCYAAIDRVQELERSVNRIRWEQERGMGRAGNE